MRLITFKKTVKILLWVVVGILGFLLLLCALVYLPPVQKFAIGKVSAIVRQSSGMQLSVEKFRLRFPIGVSLGQTALVTPVGDTLVGFDRLKGNLALWPLLAGDIRATGISLENASATYRDTVSTMLLRARLDAFSVRSATLRLRDNSVRISRAALSGADVKLDLGAGDSIPDMATDDTTASGAWKFRLRRFDLSNIKFDMAISSQDSRLAVDLPRGTIRQVTLDLVSQSVEVGRIRLIRGDYGYFTGNPAPSKGLKPVEVNDPTADTLPWTIKVGSVVLAHNSAAFGSMYGTPAPGFDPQHIRADSIELLVEDVYYRGSDISAGLRKLEFRERSGLAVMRGRADFAMNESGMSLKNLDLATADSKIKADVEVGAGVMNMAASAPVVATINASVGADDIFLFMPVDASLRRAIGGESLTIDGDFNGTLGNLSIDKLAAKMGGRIQFDAHGRIRSINSPKNIAGQISFKGSLRNLGFAKEMIADTALRRRIDFPPLMTLHGDVSFNPDLYEIPNFTLIADKGRLDLNGRFAVRSEEYQAEVVFDDFPLHSFLPNDSLGKASLFVTARGDGLDPFNGMAADVTLGIDSLDYKGFRYRDMKLAVSLAEAKFDGHLTSSNEALSLDLGFEGILDRDKYEAGIHGNIWRADLHKMGFSEGTLAVTTQIDINGAAMRDTTKMRFRLDATIDSTVVRVGEVSQRVALTRIRANADDRETSANIRSGDFHVDFASPMSIDSLVLGFGSVGNEVKRQLEARNLSMNSLQRIIPDIRLTASAGRNNALREIVRENSMDFHNFSVKVSTADGEPFRVDGEVNGFQTAGLTLDTINVWMRNRDDKLGYSLRLANRPGNIETLALIWVYGDIGGNRGNLNIYQRNRADSVGFRFGFNAELFENSVRAAMVPQTPILGYESWIVNEGNYVEYNFDGKFFGDLHLKGPGGGQHVDLSSTSMQDVPQGALRLDMGGINISNIVELFPTAPPLGGIVSSDITFGLNQGVIAAKGTLGIKDFMYERRRIADVDATIDFQSDNTGRMVLDGGIDIEKRTALRAAGYYITKGVGDMNFTVTIPHLPLSVVNGFLPPKTASLSGSLDGNVAITGAPSSLSINGDLGFTDGRAEIEMIGTAYKISTDRITVRNSRLDFNDFGIVAPNSEKLGIDGTIDMSDFANMKADLHIMTNNFEAINSSHIGGSQAYGKTWLDIDISAKGPFNALSIRGDVDLSGNTDVVYIMRNQSQNIRDEKQGIVEFVVFADSLYMAMADTIPRFRSGGMDILVGVNIEEGLRATLSLDELNENRVEVIGGGELSFAMNNQGDTRLSGRYTLSGGTVYYKPPMISQKVFAVKDGSYIEWIGELADPTFNITATQTMKVKIKDIAEEVRFNISIIIAGSLQGIEVLFDVAAPEEAAIQSELQSLGQEQRMSQAISLLLYNQYTGPSFSSESSGGFDARDQINKFISKEVNQWARNNLKGVDFSMGIDTKDDTSGNTHTDYSYSVSKSLFSDRVKMTIGGSVSDNASAQDFSDNLVDDITLEYRLTKRDNLFLKVYRYNTQESILEGEVTETGGGFLMRKKMNRFGDLFRIKKSDEKQKERQKKREEQRVLREQEKAAEMNQSAVPKESPAAEDMPDPANIQNQATPVL